MLLVIAVDPNAVTGLATIALAALAVVQSTLARRAASTQAWTTIAERMESNLVLRQAYREYSVRVRGDVRQAAPWSDPSNTFIRILDVVAAEWWVVKLRPSRIFEQTYAGMVFELWATARIDIQYLRCWDAMDENVHARHLQVRTNFEILAASCHRHLRDQGIRSRSEEFPQLLDRRHVRDLLYPGSLRRYTIGMIASTPRLFARQSKTTHPTIDEDDVRFVRRRLANEGSDHRYF